MVMPWYANGTVLDYIDKKKLPYADRYRLVSLRKLLIFAI
jgi:hypothetical protein